MAKQYNRVMLGSSGMYSEKCVKGGYIGTGFCPNTDMSDKLAVTWQEFNQTNIPLCLAEHPDKTRVAAGLACGFLWTICKGLQIGDVVLSPNGKGAYYIGEIAGDYFYVPGTELPHRRPVKWRDKLILRSDMSDALKRSTGSIGTCCNITSYVGEIESLYLNSTTTQTMFTPAVPAAKVKTKRDEPQYHERDLHKLLCHYLRKQDIFARTIFHEHSQHTDKNNEWLHPDIVAVSFASLKSPFSEALMRSVSKEQIATFYSYELKRRILSDTDLKQAFFQALSNSSWAHYGYLVAFEIDNNLMEELKRLNTSFGIGVIRLQPEPDATEILFPARLHSELDYATLDKLCDQNPDFRKFIDKVTRFIDAPKGYSDSSKKELDAYCDAIFDAESEIQQYCQEKNIPY